MAHRRIMDRVLLWFAAGLILAAGRADGEEQRQAGAAATPSDRATEAIRLIESTDPYQRQLGFLRLEALRNPATLDVVKRHLADRDPDMRAYSLRALAAIGGSAAVPTLLNALHHEKHSTARRAALLGLEPLQQNDPAVLPAFIAALRDKSTEVRITAVDIVSRIDHPRAKEAILQRNKREYNRNVRRALSLAMKRLGK